MDIKSCQHLGSFRFMWKRSKFKLVLSGLKMALVSNGLVCFIDKAKIYQGFKNDHSITGIKQN